jgi:hypothetical protein
VAIGRRAKAAPLGTARANGPAVEAAAGVAAGAADVPRVKPSEKVTFDAFVETRKM